MSTATELIHSIPVDPVTGTILSTYTFIELSDTRFSECIYLQIKNKVFIQNLTAYSKAVFLTVTSGTILIVLSLLGGKEDLFLLLNLNLGVIADVFFHYITYLGDGIMWAPLTILVFIYRRKFLPLALAAIIISTLIVQTSKHYIFNKEVRPTNNISINKTAIHTVEGVELHGNNSFPSGHNTTIFSIYLIACLLINKRYFWLAGFFIALITGYSRIYLAQHYPLDAGAGMIAAVITLYLSNLIQQKFDNRKR
jgi:membrane-associated phospholipid phosphatase